MATAVVTPLLFIIGGLFLPAFAQRSWVLAPIVATELTIFSYRLDVVGMTVRYAVALAAALIAAPALVPNLRPTDPKLLRVLIPAVALVLIATVVNTMSSSADYAFKYLRYQVVQFIPLLLAACLLRDRKSVERIAWLALALGVAVSATAIWQHYDRGTALYGDATPAIVAGWNGRSLGFAQSPVHLANQLSFVIMPVLGILLCGPWQVTRGRALLAAAALVIAAGLYFSYTRSAFYAIAPGVATVALLMGGQRRKLLCTILVLSVVVFELARGTGLVGSRYYRDSTNDRSAASHLALFQVGLAVALDNPIVGIGHEHFQDVSTGYVDAVNLSPEESAGVNSVGQTQVHNDFLNVWISWGIAGLIAYAGLFLGALLNFSRAARARDPFIRSLAIGGAGGVAMYAFGSSFHNYLDISACLWLLAGVSVALARLAENQPMGTIAEGSAAAVRSIPEHQIAFAGSDACRWLSVATRPRMHASHEASTARHAGRSRRIGGKNGVATRGGPVPVGPGGPAPVGSGTRATATDRSS